MQEALFLIEAPGVDIDAPVTSGTTPLMLAAGHGKVDVVRALVAKGAILNAKNVFGVSALHMAIAQTRRAVALFHINEAPGVDIGTLDGQRQAALSLAAGVGDMAVIKALVAKGADVNEKNEAGVAPLHAAIYQAQEEAALYLVEEVGVTVMTPTPQCGRWVRQQSSPCAAWSVPSCGGCVLTGWITLRWRGRWEQRRTGQSRRRKSSR